jgi:heterotetrameric sarcosine oxidase gamma subunit
VALFDMSFMSKFLVQGREAGRVLEHLSANRVDGAVGVVTYTQWLNQLGTLEADVTVTKLAADRFLVVATDTMHRHVEAWLHRHLGDAHAFVTDVTSGYTQLSVQGPRSRELLQSVVRGDLSNAAFPFRAAREVELGSARVLLVRITYVGELGFELYIPTENAEHVYEALTEAGAGVGLEHAGLKALSSLRLEKGYRDYGHDLDNTDNPFEVGLGFAVAVDKPGGFLGQAAARRAKGQPLGRRLVQVLLKVPEPLLFHAEVLKRDGHPVGTVRSGSYGFTLGGAVGLAMVEGKGAVVDEAYLEGARWEVDVAGRSYPAVVSARPLYDPQSQRVKG